MLQIEVEEIVRFQKSKEPGYFYSKCPKEFLNTGYIYGQTIILHGDKDKYSGLEEFWLSCMAWYSTDGQDTFYEKKIFEDLTSNEAKQVLDNIEYLKSFKNELTKAISTPKDFYLEKISRYIQGIKLENLIIMDPTWNEEKILFTDELSYYLYYFWTGE